MLGELLGTVYFVVAGSMVGVGVTYLMLQRKINMIQRKINVLEAD